MRSSLGRFLPMRCEHRYSTDSTFFPLVNVGMAITLVSKRRHIAQTTYLIVLVGFLISPYSLFFIFGYLPFTWLHLIALVVLLSPLAAKIPSWLISDKLRQLTAVALLAFVGTMAQHLMGGLLFELTLGVVGGVDPITFRNRIWLGIALVYPEERLFIVALSTFLAVAILASTRRWLGKLPSMRGSTSGAQNSTSGA